MRLVQNDIFRKREFELIDNTINIKTKSTMGTTKMWSLKIENLGHDKYYKSYSKIGVYIIASFFALIPVMTIIAYILQENHSENIFATFIICLVCGGLSYLIFKAPMNSMN